MFTQADLRRIDLKTAMCHFEPTVREIGMEGRWIYNDPRIEGADELTEYRMSWVVEVGR